MVRVLIVRDTEYFGGQVHVSLSAQPDIHVVGAVSLEDDVAGYAAATSPEVIVIDTGLMVGQVLPIADELHALPRGAGVEFDEAREIGPALELGAIGENFRFRMGQVQFLEQRDET